MSTSGGPSHQDISAILAVYDLDGLLHYFRVERGFANEKWLLETVSGRYILKQRRAGAGSSLIEAQHALVGYLRSAGFPAPALIQTRNDKTLVAHGGEVYELQEYLSGNPYEAANPAHLAAAGRMLGLYHKAVAGFDHHALHRPTERYGCVALRHTMQALLENWDMPAVAGLGPLIQQLEQHALDLETRYALFEHLSELVIHGDYHADNLIFRDGEVAGVVDYDLAHWCWRALEVAEAVIAFCTHPGLNLTQIVYPGALDLERARRFLAAYQKEVPLEEGEAQALPALVRTIWLCASLDPPLGPQLRVEAAPGVLPEILTLADWAVDYDSELVEICLSAREGVGARSPLLSEKQLP